MKAALPPKAAAMAMESAACRFRCGGRGRPCLKAAERGDNGAGPAPDEFSFIPRIRLVGDGLRDPASSLPVRMEGLCLVECTQH